MSFSKSPEEKVALPASNTYIFDNTGFLISLAKNSDGVVGVGFPLFHYFSFLYHNLRRWAKFIATFLEGKIANRFHYLKFLCRYSREDEFHC